MGSGGGAVCAGAELVDVLEEGVLDVVGEDGADGSGLGEQRQQPEDGQRDAHFLLVPGLVLDGLVHLLDHLLAGVGQCGLLQALGQPQPRLLLDGHAHLQVLFGHLRVHLLVLDQLVDEHLQAVLAVGVGALHCPPVRLPQLPHRRLPHLRQLTPQLLLLHGLEQVGLGVCAVGLGVWAVGVEAVGDGAVGEGVEGVGLGRGGVEVVVELPHRLIFLQQALVVLEQLLVLLLVVGLVGAVLAVELDGVAAEGGPRGVVDGGGLVGPDGVEVVDAAGQHALALQPDALLRPRLLDLGLVRAQGHFLLHQRDLSLQGLQLLQERFVFANEEVLVLEEGVGLGHEFAVGVLEGVDLVDEVGLLLGEACVVPEGVVELDGRLPALEGVVVADPVQLELHPAQLLLQPPPHLAQLHSPAPLRAQLLLQPLHCLALGLQGTPQLGHHSPQLRHLHLPASLSGVVLGTVLLWRVLVGGVVRRGRGEEVFGRGGVLLVEGVVLAGGRLEGRGGGQRVVLGREVGRTHAGPLSPRQLLGRSHRIFSPHLNIPTQGKLRAARAGRAVVGVWVGVGCGYIQRMSLGEVGAAEELMRLAVTGQQHLDALVGWYRGEIDRFNDERAEWALHYEQVKASASNKYALEQQLDRSRHRNNQLEAALNTTKAALNIHRQQYFQMLEDSQAVKARLEDNRKRYRELVALCKPISVAKHKEQREQREQRERKGAGGSRVSSGGDSSVRQGGEAELELINLGKQHDQRRAGLQAQIDRLKDELEEILSEHGARGRTCSAEYRGALDGLGEAETKLMHLTAEYFKLRMGNYEEERRVQEENEILRLKAVAAARKLQGLRESHCSELRGVEEVVRQRGKEFRSKYDEELRNKEQHLAMLKEQHDKISHIYLLKLKKLEADLKDTNERQRIADEKGRTEINSLHGQIRILKGRLEYDGLRQMRAEMAGRDDEEEEESSGTLSMSELENLNREVAALQRKI